MVRPRRAAIQGVDLHVRVQPGVYAALIAEASRDNTTLTAIVHRALDYYQAHAPGAVSPAPKAVAS